MLLLAMALVSRIDNVHIYVRDMQRSRAFYRDVLGLPLEGDEHWMQADLDGVRFALHATPEGVEPTAGTAFINFEVGEADAAAEHVRAAGHDPTEVMREEYGTSFEVLDPDGYRIHLFQPPA
jgi:catechol 2,3-dioxygenase-like lactoylglutathione lyase family enzyme